MGSIVRKWEATIARGDVEHWQKTFMDRAFPGMSAKDGFQGIRVLLSRGGDPCRITVLTFWRDMKAIQNYAGDDPARTVMPDFMAPFFPKYDPEATFHDEVLVEAG